MLRPRSLGRASRDEAGFTLIETLVAMVTGVIITGALFAILEVSVHQSSRLSDYAQATQLSRTTMTHIVDELHSACLSPNATPIITGSNESKLIFETGYSEKTEVPSAATATTGARKDEIIWDETKKTLTDYTYLSTGGSWPSYTYSASATPVGGVRIGEKITRSEVENAKKEKEKVPIFKYYAYATTPSTSAVAPSSTLNETTLAGAATVPGLTSTEAEKVASVLISFRTAPNSGSEKLGRAADLSTQVTLAFSAPSSEATIVAAPCE
jgi:Tfp pilus assembly protein PilV